MQTGAQLLDERVPLQIREQALVTANPRHRQRAYVSAQKDPTERLLE
jgi:hypothetical protein